MRIAFFSWESLNSIPVGGVAAVVTQLAEALAQQDHEVHVFTRINEGQREHQKIKGVHEHRCITPGCDDFIEYCDHMCDSMVSCYHWAKDEYGEFDALHGHDWHVINALANIKHHTKKEFTWTCHSTEWGRTGNSYNDNRFSSRVRHREWLGGYLAKQVTTVSKAMKAELMTQYQIPDHKINVTYNGIKAGQFRGRIDAGRVKERYGIWPLDPTVLFLGRMCHQKGPDLLLEAVPDVLRRFPSTEFVFAGGGDGMIDHINGRASYLGVDDHVHVLGYVSDRERIDLYKGCDFVCIPSRNEPFGIVTLEAWAASKPVVATNTGGPGEIIENFKTGVKVYHSPDSISWGIKYMLGDPTGESIRQMGEVCRRKSREFTWPEIGRQYVDVYQTLL